MDPLHMVEQIVVPRKAIAWYRTFAVGVFAYVGSIAMTVETMCFALVAEEAGCRGEFDVGASVAPASKGFDVGVDVFANTSQLAFLVAVRFD